jgi:Component of IIS longevity pathway SMK-1
VQVDLALSFQDNAGCLDIWHQINQFQARAAEWIRNQGIQDEGGPASTALARDVSTSVTDMAQAVAAAHHANLQQQQQRAMWINLASESQQYNFQLSLEDDDDNIGMDQNPELIAVNMAAAAAAAYGENSGIDLPTPPALQNLEDIVGIIASIQSLPQREALAIRLSKKECSYFKELLQLFVPAESRQDYGALATLAACVKTILLLNDPSIIDFVVHNEIVYELVCSTLEYDPDLRDKANHRWFLKQRAKFRTVVMMEVR